MRKYFVITAGILAGLGMILFQRCKGKPAAKENQTQQRGFEFRDKLSDYGFFKGALRELDPHPGVVRYELSTPLFTDYAIKDRFIVLPRDSQAHYTARGPLGFPDSTIIVKNFAYINERHQKVLIETRLLVKDPADHEWKVMNYLWNREQTEALKHITGARVPIRLLDDDQQLVTTVYQVPNTNDCKRCHTQDGQLLPIGPKARNLNFSPAFLGHNQLTDWATRGLLAGLPDLKTVDQLPAWNDAGHYTLEQRARAYLDMNCAHCHTRAGDAYNTGLFLEYGQTDPHALGVLKSPVSAGGGAGGLNYDIVPGDAKHSILAYRMNSTEPGTAMPELARTVIHKEGVKLIMDWINAMPAKK
ncbi:SO2930 family diheme c-type cytochrome [Niabella hirudinis]|uniref:SO2930 family diheme c-type cytochrome n=1 Tax=Niabella hirudinis TaxID=1285929 RepID=UPI003EBCCED9